MVLLSVQVPLQVFQEIWLQLAQLHQFLPAKVKYFSKCDHNLMRMLKAQSIHLVESGLELEVVASLELEVVSLILSILNTVEEIGLDFK